MTIRVFDFFSGCGGTSVGFANAGCKIEFSLDIDKDAINTFKKNFPDVDPLCADITEVEPTYLCKLIENRDAPLLFCGCAPCQPFSKQNRQKELQDPRKNLLLEFSKFIIYWKPEFLMVENVPGLQKIQKEGPLRSFLDMLDYQGYKWSLGVLPAFWFGVPQKRERLVLLASLWNTPGLPENTHGLNCEHPYSTVREWIYDLPKLEAGKGDPFDKDHVAARLSNLNLKRISITPEGGGRQNWPEELWLDCHKRHKGHTDVYGRLSWDKPASGLTTRCISYSNGRFGHPEQNRAISLREAACLQTFPRNYKFTGGLQSKARQVGNAVPPLMAQRIAEHLQKVM